MRILRASLLSCLTIAFAQGRAQAPALTDRQQIERTIQNYFDGWATGDSALIGRAMHESLHLKRSLEGKFVDMTRQQYVGGMRLHPRDSTLEAKVAYIDIVGNIASARIELSIAASTFVDYFNLLKTDEGWLIYDKISTRVPRGSTSAPTIRPIKETILTGLRRPWSMAFLSEEEALISEKEGDLLRVNLRTRERRRINGFPADMADSVGAFGTGDNTGKFDVVVDPSFRANNMVYLAYAATNGRGRATKVVRATLRNDSLHDIRTLLVAEPYVAERVHYGGGMVFGNDGKLYVTIGERLFYERDEPALPYAQNPAERRGKIFRINSDGTIPNDNPDCGRGAVPGIYASGIRSSQGLTVHPITNTIWFTDHGTNQGDEVNVLRAGANYGWPLRTTGRYRDSTYHPPAPADSLTDPVWSWPHTVAPTALTFYSGREFPEWNGSLLIGGLSRGSLWRLAVSGETIESAEELFVNDRERLREIIQSPGGALYALTDYTDGKLIRIRNAARAATDR